MNKRFSFLLFTVFLIPFGFVHAETVYLGSEYSISLEQFEEVWIEENYEGCGGEDYPCGYWDWVYDEPIIIGQGGVATLDLDKETHISFEAPEPTEDECQFRSEDLELFYIDNNERQILQSNDSGGFSLQEGVYEADLYVGCVHQVKNDQSILDRVFAWMRPVVAYAAPYGEYVGTIRFSVNDVTESQLLTPVVIVPGIVGSELYNGEDLIWMDLSQTSGVGDYFLTDNLSLDSSGNSIKDITVGNVIKEITAILVINKNFFEDLQEVLELNEYKEDNNLFFFSYDWRLDLDVTKDLLDQKIEEVKTQTGSEKVNIVAHSMGGLLVKNYLSQYNKQSVDKLIFVGTPHLGAPKVGKVLLEGDRFSMPWLDPDRIKEIAANSPALHQLLPSPVYFNEFQGYLKKYDLLGNNDLLNYEETKSFFLDDKEKNSLMFQVAEYFYDKNLQDFDFSGVETYNIAGCKTPTQSAYRFGIFGEIGGTGYSSGDGTVPLVSSDYINISTENKYYVKDGEHAELSSTEGVRDLILTILNEGENTIAPNINNDSSFCNFKGKSLSWHSPVEVHIYDARGNHTGPIENGVEYGIKGVDYEIINHQKFIFLPTNEGQEYQVVAIGEEEGSFDLKVSEIEDGQYLNTQIFNNVPVDVGDEASFIVNQSNKNESILLETKDGEFEVLVSAEISGDNVQDLTPPETTIKTEWIKNKKSNKSLQVVLEATDNMSGVLGTMYSLDNGDTFNKYSDSFVVDNKKVDNILYYSTDRVGNDEEVKIFSLKENKHKKCKSWKCLEINKKHKFSKDFYKNIHKKLDGQTKNLVKKFKKHKH